MAESRLKKILEKRKLNKIEKQVDKMKASPNAASRTDYMHQEVDNLGKGKKSRDYIDYVRQQADEKAREQEEKNRLMGMRPRAYGGKYNVPTSDESKKQMDDWDRKRKEGKEEQSPGTGESAGKPCPECGSTATQTTNKPNVIYCPVCKKSYVVKKEREPGESSIPSLLHSSFTIIIISAIIGLMVPLIFGPSFGTLGTGLIGLGIIFLGLSKI